MAKIAISLPDEILDAVEKERIRCGISRSEYFRRTVEEHLRREKEREDVERYIQGYLEDPETPEELEWVVRAGLEALADIPWEEDGQG
ncbi:MAG: ribbon-helix-helix protein, CopG family [Chloroflexi bacterium]|nr:ribbon-helix-helix protein, CopG family [Chloroflexota bacterium]MDA1270825.1 ribbon-helix-helix protein, CopG family [Chloroflexota bacterium]